MLNKFSKYSHFPFSQESFDIHRLLIPICVSLEMPSQLLGNFGNLTTLEASKAGTGIRRERQLGKVRSDKDEISLVKGAR